MKKMITIALCTIMMVVCSTATQAQENTSKKQRMSREQMAEAQAKRIIHELALDETTSRKFIETYQNYQKELWALGPRAHRNHQQAQTDAEAEQAIKSRMERSQKILDLREKYYKQYSQFLTQKQIQRIYEIEQKTMKRIAKRGKARQGRPGRQGHRREAKR